VIRIEKLESVFLSGHGMGVYSAQVAAVAKHSGVLIRHDCGVFRGRPIVPAAGSGLLKCHKCAGEVYIAGAIWFAG